MGTHGLLESTQLRPSSIIHRESVCQSPAPKRTHPHQVVDIGLKSVLLLSTKRVSTLVQSSLESHIIVAGSLTSTGHNLGDTATLDDDDEHADAPVIPAPFLTSLDVSYEEQVKSISHPSHPSPLYLAKVCSWHCQVSKYDRRTWWVPCYWPLGFSAPLLFDKNDSPALRSLDFEGRRGKGPSVNSNVVSRRYSDVVRKSFTEHVSVGGNETLGGTGLVCKF